MKPREFEGAKLLWKMFYAQQCFKHAQAAAEHILKERLENENPLFYLLVTSVYVMYGKPFTVERVSCGTKHSRERTPTGVDVRTDYISPSMFARAPLGDGGRAPGKGWHSPSLSRFERDSLSFRSRGA